MLVTATPPKQMMRALLHRSYTTVNGTKWFRTSMKWRSDRVATHRVTPVGSASTRKADGPWSAHTTSCEEESQQRPANGGGASDGVSGGDGGRKLSTTRWKVAAEAAMAPASDELGHRKGSKHKLATFILQKVSHKEDALHGARRSDRAHPPPEVAR